LRILKTIPSKFKHGFCEGIRWLFFPTSIDESKIPPQEGFFLKQCFIKSISSGIKASSGHGLRCIDPDRQYG
jgi:hypothetical protein